MKTYLLAALAFFPCLALAGTHSTVVPPEVTQELTVMTGRLNLSQNQQDKMRPILVDEWYKKQSILDSTLSDRQKHDQTGAIHRAALQKIKALFTTQQMTQIEQEQDHPSPSSTRP